jgi:tRNA 2-thiouridine synthesizing protein A
MTEEIKISTIGMNCPKPLIETRKALRKLEKGQILIVEGDHEISKKEIPQAMKDTGDEVISIDEKGANWVIKIRKVN